MRSSLGRSYFKDPWRRIDGMKDTAARARADALFRKDDERALKAPRPTDTAQAEKTARLRALRLAEEDADQAQAQDRR